VFEEDIKKLESLLQKMNLDNKKKVLNKEENLEDSKLNASNNGGNVGDNLNK
jgi:hypothetical protein